MATYQTATDINGRKWPTRRMAAWASTNNITSVAALDAWLTANVTTIAQARVVFRELIVSLFQISNSGEADGGG
jgi:hypothetical protein